MSEYVGNKNVKFPIKGRTNPALTEFNGKKYIIPYYIEVPMDTTLADVHKWVIWERPPPVVKKEKKKKVSLGDVKPKVRRKKKSISLADPEPKAKPQKKRRKSKVGVINLGD